MGLPLFTVMDVRLEQPANAIAEMVCVFSGIMMAFKDVQLLKTSSSMVVILLESFTDSKTLQLAKAFIPIVVTLSGIVTLVNPVEKKARLPIEVIVFGMLLVCGAGLVVVSKKQKLA